MTLDVPIRDDDSPADYAAQVLQIAAVLASTDPESTFPSSEEVLHHDAVM
jgi:hypothetical protein